MQIGVLCSQWIVFVFMKLHAVATSGFKTGTGNLVKTTGMLLQGSLQDRGLFWCRIELYNKCSIHDKSISYRATSVNKKRLPSLPKLDFVQFGDKHRA